MGAPDAGCDVEVGVWVCADAVQDSVAGEGVSAVELAVVVEDVALAEAEFDGDGVSVDGCSEGWVAIG